MNSVNLCIPWKSFSLIFPHYQSSFLIFPLSTLSGSCQQSSFHSQPLSDWWNSHERGWWSGKVRNHQETFLAVDVSPCLFIILLLIQHWKWSCYSSKSLEISRETTFRIPFLWCNSLLFNSGKEFGRFIVNNVVIF